MAKRGRKTRMTPEEEARWQAEYDERTRLLEERIAYHRARTAQEQALAAEQRARRERRRHLLARLLPWRA